MSHPLYDVRLKVDPKLTEQCVKNLVFIGRAMHLNPELCFAEDTADEEEEGEQDAAELDETEEEDAEEEDEGDVGGDAAVPPTDSTSTSSSTSNKKTLAAPADPLRWVFNRMSHMVVHKGEARRRAVFSWFLAMAAIHEPVVSTTHLMLMLLPLRRAVLDAESGGVEHKAMGSTVDGGRAGGAGRGAAEKQQTSAELATEVRKLLWAGAVMLMSSSWPICGFSRHGRSFAIRTYVARINSCEVFSLVVISVLSVDC